MVVCGLLVVAGVFCVWFCDCGLLSVGVVVGCCGVVWQCAMGGLCVYVV